MPESFDKAIVIDKVADKAVDLADKLSPEQKEEIKNQNDITKNLVSLREFSMRQEGEDAETDAMKQSALNTAIKEISNEYKDQGITEEIIRSWIAGEHEEDGGYSVDISETQDTDQTIASDLESQTSEDNEKEISEKELSKELVDYFGLQAEEKEIRDNLKVFGFGLNDVLGKYKNYIENDLKLPDGSTLSPSDHQKMKVNLQKIIKQTVLTLPKTTEEIRKKYDGNLQNKQWIANEEFQDKISSIGETLLPSAKFLLAMHDPKFAEYMEKTYRNDGKISDLLLHAKSRLMDTEDALINGNFKDGKLPKGLFYNDALIVAFLNKDAPLLDDILLQKIGLEKENRKNLKNVSFLSEKDQEIESSAMMYYMGAIICQIIPYIGAVVSVPVDLADTINSNSDATMSYLRRLNLVPKEYEMRKTHLDQALAGLGILASILGAQALVKGGKIANSLRKIRGFTPAKFEKVLKNLGNMMGIGTEKIDNVIKFLFKSGTESAGTVRKEGKGAENAGDVARGGESAAEEVKTAEKAEDKASEAEKVKSVERKAEEMNQKISKELDELKTTLAQEISTPEFKNKKMELKNKKKAKTATDDDKDLLDKMQAKEDFVKILNGEITKANYSGIRDIGKALKLDIEQQLFLVKKVLEKSGMDMGNLIDFDKGLSEIRYARKGFKEINLSSDEMKMFQKLGLKIEGLPAEDLSVLQKLFKELKDIPDIDILTKVEKEKILKSSVNYLQDLRKAITDGSMKQMKPEEIFDLLQENQKNLIHLNITDRRYFTGSDHGVTHILDGNMAMAEKLMDDLKMPAKDRVLVRQAIIDHDMGYTIEMIDGVKDGRYFGMTKDHPLYSTVWLEQNKEKYIKRFGESGYEVIRKAVLDHSNASQFDINAKGDNLIKGIVAGVDCLGVTADVKMMRLFREPEMMDSLQRIGFIWKDVKAGKLTHTEAVAQIGDIKKTMMNWVTNHKSFSPEDKKAYTQALEMNFDPANTEFAVNRDFGSYIASFGKVEAKEGKLKITFNIQGDAQALIKRMFGDKTATNSLVKGMEDYGLKLKSGEKRKVKINGLEKDYSIEDFAKEIEELKPGESIKIETPRGEFEFRKPTEAEAGELGKDMKKMNERFKRNNLVHEALEALENPILTRQQILDNFDLLKSKPLLGYAIQTPNGLRKISDIISPHVTKLENITDEAFAVFRQTDEYKRMAAEVRQIRNSELFSAI